MTNKRPLSGSDYFHLLLDRKMLRNGSVGNISRIHLELDPNSDMSEIESRLRSNKTLQTVSQLQVQLRWPQLPVWKLNDEKNANIASAENLSESSFHQQVLNRKVDNTSGLAFVDLCTLTDGTKHVVITMHHVLFDHQGMMNFVRALSDGSVTFPLFPEPESSSWFARLRNAFTMTVYMLSRSSWQLGSLVNRHEKPKASPIFKIIEFDQETTAHIEKNAWDAGARIGQSAFYIAAVAQIVLNVLRGRAQKPKYLWFSVPHNQRRRGTAGHLVSNQLSFLFFKLLPAQLGNLSETVSAINSQLKTQIKDRITERYEDLQASLRYMPLAVYEWMVDLASNGKVASFGFSDLGEEKQPIKDFLGATVIRTDHYPPVPSPPGFNVAAMKTSGKLKFVWAYFDESVSEEEAGNMELQFKELLLNLSPK